MLIKEINEEKRSYVPQIASKRMEIVVDNYRNVSAKIIFQSCLVMSRDKAKRVINYFDKQKRNYY